MCICFRKVTSIQLSTTEESMIMEMPVHKTMVTCNSGLLFYSFLQQQAKCDFRNCLLEDKNIGNKKMYEDLNEFCFTPSIYFYVNML